MWKMLVTCGKSAQSQDANSDSRLLIHKVLVKSLWLKDNFFVDGRGMHDVQLLVIAPMSHGDMLRVETGLVSENDNDVALMNGIAIFRSVCILKVCFRNITVIDVRIG